MPLEVNHELCYLLIAQGLCLLCSSPVQPKQVDKYLSRAGLCLCWAVGGFLLSALHPFSPGAEELLHWQGCRLGLAESCLEKSLAEQQQLGALGDFQQFPESSGRGKEDSI